MTEITKIEAPGSKSSGERTGVALILALLVAVQVLYVAKHSVTFAAIVAAAPFGIVAP